jgi:hypothetical protein
MHWGTFSADVTTPAEDSPFSLLLEADEAISGVDADRAL